MEIFKGWISRRSLGTAVLLVTLALVLRLLTVADVHKCLTQPRVDFRAFYWAARCLVAGEPIDSGPAFAARNGTKILSYLRWLYPPPGVLLFVPFTLLDEYPAQVVFYMLMSLSIVLLMAIVGEQSGRPVAGTIIAMIWSAPFIKAIVTCGQLTTFTTLAFTVALLLLKSGRWAGAGVIIAVSTLVKPMEIFFWWPLFLAVDRRSLAAFCLTVVSVSLLSLAVTGSGPWLSMLGFIRHRADSGHCSLHYLLMMLPLLALSARHIGDSGRSTEDREDQQWIEGRPKQ